MILTAAEMLAALVGQPVDFTVDGLGTVRVRGLSVLEYSTIKTIEGQGDEKMLMAFVQAGLVEPALTREQIESISIARAKPLAAIGRKIMALSAEPGAADEEGQASFGGGGSSSAQATPP